MDNKSLNYIKKHYGEQFAKLCRGLFPCLLDVPANEPNSLQNVLTKYFDNSPTLCEDLSYIKSTFRDVVYTLAKYKSPIELAVTDKTPEELLSEKGYVLFKCESEEDIQRFKILYKVGEELCTFKGGRLNDAIVYFAVRKEFFNENPKTGELVFKDVKDFPFKREDYKTPKREDDYGTSVMSIQFTHGNTSQISIITRYNHKVVNPNNTYGNNLELICPGLTDAFAKKENLNFAIDNDCLTYFNEYMQENGYIFDKNNKMHKIITKIADGYACLNNYVVRGRTCGLEPILFDESRYILFDNYIIDQKHKGIMDISKICYIAPNAIDSYFENLNTLNIKNFDKKLKENLSKINEFGENSEDFLEYYEERTIYNDAFTNSFGEIKNVNISNDNNKNKVISLVPKDGETIQIVINKNGHIIKYSNPNITTIEDNFLKNATYLEEINLPNVETVADNFLENATYLEEINLPNIETVGNNFLGNNKNLTQINLPKVKKIGNSFLCNNQIISNVELPNIEIIGDNFIPTSKNITSINFPKLKKVGDNFVNSSENINFVNIPNVNKIGKNFLFSDKTLTSINLPNVSEIGSYFLNSNISLKQIDLPNAVEINCYFMPCNENLTSINAPFLYYFYETEFLSKNKNREEFLKKMKTIQKQNRDNTYN